jgi:uncharacterized alpha-E superfamily protein
MLSRVANSIYWMSRYMERADNVARFIEVNQNLMRDADVGAEQQWMPLVHTSGDHQDFTKRYGEASEENVVRFLAFDSENPNSIFSCIRSARENARTVREIITTTMWNQLNEFYLFVKEMTGNPASIQSLSRFFEQVRRGANTFKGLTDSSMTRDETWRFDQLGRFLEIADKTSRILDVKYFLLLRTANDVGTPFDHIQWGAVLKSASAFEMYRKKHGRISPEDVVEFMLLDHQFPRAVRFCLDEAMASLKAISGAAPGIVTNKSERKLGQLCSELTYKPVSEIIQGGLHEYLDTLQNRMNEVGAAIRETFFAHKVPNSYPTASRWGQAQG